MCIFAIIVGFVFSGFTNTPTGRLISDTSTRPYQARVSYYTVCLLVCLPKCFHSLIVPIVICIVKRSYYLGEADTHLSGM